MYRIYYNRTTPILAFLEGMMRVFDWGRLLEMSKRWRKRRSEPAPKTYEDEQWGDRIVDWYIRDAIATFETEEFRKLSEEPILPRRSSASANIVLGPLPNQEVILRYEQVVAGACDRIMGLASEKLDHDGKAEIELLRERAKQGFMGMAAGFVLSLLLAVSAMFLLVTGNDLAGFSIVGVYIAIPVAVSVYISKAKVRDKLYTRDFFSWKRHKP